MKKTFTLFILFACSFTFVLAQIDNPGFEAWEDAGTVLDEPVNWSSIKTSDNDFLSGAAPVVWEQSTDAHTGSYSVKLYNVLVLPGLIAAGTLTNGRIHADYDPDLGYAFTDPTDDRWNMPVNFRPDSIAFWMKFFPEGNDTMQFQAMLHVGECSLPTKPENVGNKIAYTRADISGEHAGWTRYAMPFDYVSTENPEYLLIILASGNGTTPIEGSYALFDDLELIGGEQSVNDDLFNDYSVYIANKTLYLNNVPQHIIKDSKIEIVDLTGRRVFQSVVNTTEVSLKEENINEGFYIVRLTSNKGTFSKKFFIQ